MTLTSLIKRASAAAGVSVLLASAAIGYRYIALDQPIALATPSVSDFSAAARYVFIPSKDYSLVEVLDRDKDEIVGRLNPGLIPTQLVVSEAARRLAVSDTNKPSIALIDLANGRTTNIDLPFAPDRLIGSPDGYVVAAIAAKSGNIAIVDMLRGRVVSSLTGISTIREALFGPDGAFLYIAADNLKGIGVIDVARGKIIDEIVIPNLEPGQVTGLTRSSNGRTAYVKARDGNFVALIDLNNFRLNTRLNIAGSVTKIFPTGFGGYLVVPNNTDRSVTIIANSSLAVVAMLKGAEQMTVAYSGWFDTLAMVPSGPEQKLMIYDLDHLVLAAELKLPGRPGIGAVTSEGAKLYLALEDVGRVAVIDLKNRKLSAVVRTSSNPGSVIMSKSFDICH